jgi:nucleoside-diphosphate-sugar epimerase
VRVVVTGGTGFVGLAVAEALQRQDHEVVLFGAAAIPAMCAGDPALRLCQVVVGDVRSQSDVANAIDERVDVVVHGAAITSSSDVETERPSDVLAVNLQGTVEVLTRARRVGSRRVVVLSSVAAYGHAKTFGETLLHEDTTRPEPSTLYGITKLAAEQVAFRLGELWSLDIRTIRLGPVFGPWEYATGLRALSAHSQVVDNALDGTECVLERKMHGDYLYSRDAGRGIVRIVESEKVSRKIYNLGGPISTLADWCRAVERRIPAFRWRINAARPTVRSWLRHDRAVMDSGAFDREFGLSRTALVGDAVDDSILWRERARAP